MEISVAGKKSKWQNRGESAGQSGVKYTVGDVRATGEGIIHAHKYIWSDSKSREATPRLKIRCAITFPKEWSCWRMPGTVSWQNLTTDVDNCGHDLPLV
jgi:hypothetical protein